MPHRHPHKPVHHVKPKYKRLALIAAAAAMLSTTTLPGMPVATAHASGSANASNISATTSQQVAKTIDSSSQINSPNPLTVKINPKVNFLQTNMEKNPVIAQKAEQESKSPIATPKPTEETNEKSVAPEPSQDTNKAEFTTAKLGSEAKPPSSDSAPNDYKEVLDISATAYAPGAHDNDQWGDKTFIGTQVRPGIIAVDPKVIPLGSRVYIEYPDGHGEYATAEDTGGAIKGNRVDIAKQTVSEAEDFGIQNVKVYVVSTPENV